MFCLVPDHSPTLTEKWILLSTTLAKGCTKLSLFNLSRGGHFADPGQLQQIQDLRNTDSLSVVLGGCLERRQRVVHRTPDAGASRKVFGKWPT
jgi:hypothetical protein